MKLTLEHDNGKTEVFQNITDLYIAYRALKSVGTGSTLLPGVPEVRSLSWGSNLRELVKEVAQSLIELQEHLRKLREKNDGGSR